MSAYALRSSLPAMGYGVNGCLQTWVMDDNGTWIGTAGSFGTEHITNVLSAGESPSLLPMLSTETYVCYSVWWIRGSAAGCCHIRFAAH